MTNFLLQFFSKPQIFTTLSKNPPALTSRRREPPITPSSHAIPTTARTSRLVSQGRSQEELGVLHILTVPLSSRSASPPRHERISSRARVSLYREKSRALRVSSPFFLHALVYEFTRAIFAATLSFFGGLGATCYFMRVWERESEVLFLREGKGNKGREDVSIVSHVRDARRMKVFRMVWLLCKRRGRVL